MELTNNKLTASQGCLLRRKADGIIFGDTVYLGYVYQINGKTLANPYKEDETNYEEVFETEFQGEAIYLENTEYDDLLNQLIRLKYSTSQEFAILRSKDEKSDDFLAYYDYSRECRAFLRSIGHRAPEEADKTDLEIAKEDKLAEITEYDNSTAVNSFWFEGKQLWLVKADRVGLMNSTNLLKSAGKETTTLWFDYVEYTLPCDTVLSMLGIIEQYALECYNVTSKHKANVLGLATVEEVEAYDYTTGYPDKITLA